jgi:HEAT repeat protein
MHHQGALAVIRRHRPDPSERLHALLALPENESSCPALLDGVSDVSLDIARAALRRLHSLAGPAEITELRQRMLDVDIGVVGDVAATLRALNDPLAAAVATAALNDESPFLRHKAAIALRELHDPTTRLALLRALDDPETPVRRVALEALREVPPDAETIAASRRRLGDLDASVRAAALHTVACLDSDAAEMLRAVVRDREPRVRAELGAVAGALATDTLRVLLGDADPEVRASALRGLVALPRAELAPTVIAALADVNWHVRRAACDAVAASGGDGARQVLVRALIDPHPSVRGRALVALERLAGDQLHQLLAYYLDAAATPLRRALLEILGRRGQTEPLLRFVSDPSSDVRLAVVRGLSADCSAAARAALEFLCDDDDVAVRHAATTVLEAADGRRF